MAPNGGGESTESASSPQKGRECKSLRHLGVPILLLRRSKKKAQHERIRCRYRVGQCSHVTIENKWYIFQRNHAHPKFRADFKAYVTLRSPPSGWEIKKHAVLFLRAGSHCRAKKCSHMWQIMAVSCAVPNWIVHYEQRAVIGLTLPQSARTKKNILTNCGAQ